MNIKAAAHQIVDNLPEDATWTDLMYQIYIREVIEQGFEQSRQDQVISSQVIRKHFGIH